MSALLFLMVGAIYTLVLRCSESEIFFDIGVGKPAIVQVNDQFFRGNRPAGKQRANGFKNDAMLRLCKFARAKRFDEILAQIARDGLVAQRAKCPEFRC